MQQATWFTRLGPLGSLLGALLTAISIFLPLILTRPPLDARFADPYPPLLDGVWLLRSLFSPHLLPSQTSNLATLASLFASLLVLGLLTLGAGLTAVLLPDTLSAVTSWIRLLAAIGSLIVLLWFVAGIEALNMHFFGPLDIVASPRFSMGFGLVVLAVGTALGAFGLGRVGIAAAVGAGIGFLLLLTPLALVAFLIGTMTCILGAFIGWWVQRAARKNGHVLVMK